MIAEKIAELEAKVDALKQEIAEHAVASEKDKADVQE